MPKLFKFLKNFFFVLIYLLPAVLFCSYYPIIRLGGNTSMNFELSLPLIWLVIFDLLAFILFITISLKGNHQIKPTQSPQTNIIKSLIQVFHRPKSPPSKRTPFLSDRKFFLFALFPLYATLSIFWSSNPLRAILTAGIIWLLFFAIFALLFVTPLLHPPRQFRTHVLRAFFISSAAICVVCWVQSFLDVFGIDHSHTLLCLGCTHHSFGFPHPSGFAIEPQFMGNLLLAPTLTALYLLIFVYDKTCVLTILRNFFNPSPKTPQQFHKQSTKVHKLSTIPSNNSTNNPPKSTSYPPSQPPIPQVIHHQKGTFPQVFPKSILIFFTCLFSATLFLTFSRGAIYAYIIALASMLLFSLFYHHFRPSLIIVPLLTFLFVLCMQGIFTLISPVQDTFMSGIAKSIHQLTLGIIDLRPTPSSSNQPPIDTSEEGNRPDNPDDSSAIFEGYVAESTNVRLNLNATAIDTWLNAPNHATLITTCSDYAEDNKCHKITPTSILFGVGLGGAGTAMHNAFPDRVTSPKEIVQNQFFSLLLELGLVGLLLFIFTLILAFFAPLLPQRFVDGKQQRPASASSIIKRLQKGDFWSHPALSLLASLIIAYLATLNFFSGLPNALHIYLLPPLLFLIFLRSSKPSINR